MIEATRSADPNPFWIVCTDVSGPSSDRAERAAVSTSAALVDMMTRSQVPMPSVVVLPRTGAVRSPLMPSTRKP